MKASSCKDTPLGDGITGAKVTRTCSSTRWMAHTTAFLLIELYLPSRNRAFSLTSFLLSQRVSSVNPVGQPRQTPSAFDLTCFVRVPFCAECG